MSMQTSKYIIGKVLLEDALGKHYIKLHVHHQHEHEQLGTGSMIISIMRMKSFINIIEEVHLEKGIGNHLQKQHIDKQHEYEEHCNVNKSDNSVTMIIRSMKMISRASGA